ncbi:zinc finger protein [Thecamonas trahens ATCC 50062]|uniref:RING-type E3 ubiquitin transferase n=1 Tax=Thecamonas trahens ATCC 50062 TaxID=461836 RepID=A0A0L0DMC4_THETB|nr:zinc finger protein [Thecamonas trahens ATCC 50062]KNC53462.1 zinc finger protein [Thecamonas trahens ATCC 50062]|eukprot:XP_013761786.1 zinc finger protein [Thecamonas trahens ATCC 50062]
MSWTLDPFTSARSCMVHPPNTSAAPVGGELLGPPALAVAPPPSSAASASAAAPAVRYEWLDDSGWKPYSPELAARLAAAEQAGTTASFKFGRSRYTIDVGAGTQTNDATGFVRQVRRVDGSAQTSPDAAAGAGYEWRDDSGWKPYSPKLAARLAAAKQAGTTVSFSFGRSRYTVDVAAGTQTNDATGFVRQVRRSKSAGGSSGYSAQPSSEPSSFDIFDLSNSARYEHDLVFEVRDEHGATQGSDAEALVAQTTAEGRGTSSTETRCCICLDDFDATAIHFVACGHPFHKACLVAAMAVTPKCPLCTKAYDTLIGPQPPGTLRVSLSPPGRASVAGYPGAGMVRLDYSLPSGKAADGTQFSGTSRTGYLPETPEGLEVLCLLIRAFLNRQMFRVGTSITTGRSNQVVWNGIHAKTTLGGGPHGFPDPTYFDRVKAELASFDILPFS